MKSIILLQNVTTVKNETLSHKLITIEHTYVYINKIIYLSQHFYKISNIFL